jgi:hypothetical protein
VALVINNNNRIYRVPSRVVAKSIDHRFHAVVEKLDSPRREGSAGGVDLLKFVWLGGRTQSIYMGGLHDAREASFEAKESGESRNGIGSRWGVVSGGQRIQGNRWYGRRYTDREHGTANFPDLLSGQIQTVFVPVGSAIEFIRAGN